MAVIARKTENSLVAHKSIRIRNQNVNEAEKIVADFGVSEVTARILAARGFKSDEILKQFITPSLREGLPEPKKLLNLDSACKLISEIANAGKSIAICCDFDVDGLSGGAQVHHFFNTVGIKNKVFVPDRFEDGYGLNEKMIREIADQGFALVITIDYGTTNLKELNLAKSLGLLSVVVDHHHVGDTITPCDVFINPNQKGCDFADRLLCASGLAWYLILGLRNYFKGGDRIDVKSYLDLACLGTICDMVPLKGANRVIAKRGLEQLGKTKRPGLVALKNAIGIYKDPTCTDVSFGIGPRLNAAGRIEKGEVVIELLTTDDSEKATKIAQRLNKLNVERQDTENFVKESAVKIISSWDSLPSGLVIHDKKFHTGVIGIVAQRLVETYYRPAVVLGMDSAGIYKGSVRGIKGFNVVEALSAVGKHLIKFGGHEGAGGLSVEESKLEVFSSAFIKECQKRLKSIETEPYVEADTETSLPSLTIELINELKSFVPFGMGNPNPVLLMKKMRVLYVKVLKNTHLKAMLTDGKTYLSGLMWRQVSHPSLVKGNEVNVAFKPDINSFNGNIEIQAHLQAIELIS